MADDLDILLARVRGAFRKDRPLRCSKCGSPLELADVTRTTPGIDFTEPQPFGVMLRLQCPKHRRPLWGMIVRGAPEDEAVAMVEIEKLCRAETAEAIK